MDYTVGLVLQILTLLVAAVGPVLAYRYAKRLAINANQMAWVDALRQDVAETIALTHDFQASIMTFRTLDNEDSGRHVALNVTRERASKLQTLVQRVRLRLNSDNPIHVQLIDSIAKMVAERADPKENKVLLEEVVKAAEATIRQALGKVGATD
ncbi:MAG: hypothetical protein QOI38_1305 [Sphingomonadales bacterium]|jgi:hypothetical protein|nr:hypothetical protein [Sphingomonadales bacterium]